MMRGYYAMVTGFIFCSCAGSAIEVGPGSAAGAGGSAPVANPTSSRPSSTCTDQTPLPTWPSTAACAGSNDLPLVGSWHGYVENEAAPWDELFLRIEGANDSALCGTLKVGNVAPPPPATDGEVGYPPGAVVAPSAVNFIAGYAMTLLDGTTDGTRVRFTVSRSEAYKSWCELQRITYDYAGVGCACVPSWAEMGDFKADRCTFSDPNSGAELTVTCGKSALCGSPGPAQCTCNASGCTARTDSNLSFDLRFTGDTAEGVDSSHPGVRIHFTRSP